MSTNTTSIHLTPVGMSVMTLVFAISFGSIGYMYARLSSPEINEHYVQSLQHAADYARWDAEAAKWEAASRVFVPEINLEGVKQ